MNSKALKFISLFLVFVMSLTFMTNNFTLTVDGFAANVTADCLDISVGETKKLELDAGKTVYLKFDPTISGRYSFYSKSDIDTCGYLFDVSGNEIAFNDDVDPIFDFNFRIDADLNAGATYYFAVKLCREDASGAVLVTLECENVYCSHRSTVKYGEVAATCLDFGYEAGEFCADCGRWISGHSEIEPLGHDFSDEFTVDETPTCTKSGAKSRHCQRCEQRKDVTEIQPVGHSVVIDVRKAPTCTETGLIEGKHCSVCGEVLAEQEVIAANGHTPVTIPAVVPTCTKSGSTVGEKCSVCGTVTKAPAVVKAKGHTYKTTTTNATLMSNGSTVTKCTTCGYVKSIVTIAKIKSVSLSKTSFTYNGKSKKPTVTVKDNSGKTLTGGTDYKVTYSKGCKNVGQYTVTVTFKGNYSGTKKLTYTIVPKGTSVSKLTAEKKQFTVKWAKQSTQTSGYEIQYSTSSKMKNAKTVTIKKNSTTSATVKNLKSGKKYYVRVRTYKTVKINGKSVKLYSSQSKIKSVKTK